MDTVHVTIPSQSIHACQIVTGFLLLRDQGWDITIDDQSRDAGNPFFGLPVVLAQYRGKRLVYDLWDGYQNPDGMVLGLEHCEVYFKRSFSPEKNAALFPAFQEKMRPLGLNYHVTHPESPIREPKWKELLKPLMGKTPDRYFTTKVFEGAPRQPDQRPGKILFLTQLWDSRDPSVSEEDNAERAQINQMRTDILRALGQRYGARFVGGLRDTPLARELAPELIQPARYTERRRYLDLVKSCDICIGSMGLYESIGWKTGEYVAAAKAIVNERPRYQVPGGFAEGRNYLAFSTAQECVQAVQRLAEDPQALYAMQRANQEYYRQFLRPDTLVKNTLAIAENT